MERNSPYQNVSPQNTDNSITEVYTIGDLKRIVPNKLIENTEKEIEKRNKELGVYNIDNIIKGIDDVKIKIERNRSGKVTGARIVGNEKESFNLEDILESYSLSKYGIAYELSNFKYTHPNEEEDLKKIRSLIESIFNNNPEILYNPYALRALTVIIIPSLLKYAINKSANEETYKRALDITEMILKNLKNKAYENLGELYREYSKTMGKDNAIWTLRYPINRIIEAAINSNQYLDTLSVVVDILNNSNLDYIRKFFKEITMIPLQEDEKIKENPKETITDIAKRIAFNEGYYFNFSNKY